MQDESIQALRAELSLRYGARVVPYGTSDDEDHGTGFRLEGGPFMFSILTDEDGPQTGIYDIQLESFPAYDYLFNARLPLAELLDLIEKVACGEAPREMETGTALKPIES